MAFKIICFITCLDSEVRVAVPWVFLLPLLEDRNGICFLQHFNAPPLCCPNLKKVFERGFEWWQPYPSALMAASHPDRDCPFSLNGLILLHQPLILLVPIGLRAGIPEVWSCQDHLVRVRKVLNTSSFAMSCVTRFPFPCGSGPTFLFAADRPLEVLVAFSACFQIQLQMGS